MFHESVDNRGNYISVDERIVAFCSAKVRLRGALSRSERRQYGTKQISYLDRALV